MATIKERAAEYATHTICIKHEGKKVLACEKFLQGCTSCKIKSEAFKQYVNILTEQDRISREDERERCIMLSQDFHCSGCGFSEDCTIDSDEVGRCIYVKNDKCMDRVNIRKAIEEGGEG